MRKLISAVLVIALALSFVPATLAVGAVEAGKTQEAKATQTATSISNDFTVSNENHGTSAQINDAEDTVLPNELPAYGTEEASKASLSDVQGVKFTFVEADKYYPISLKNTTEKDYWTSFAKGELMTNYPCQAMWALFTDEGNEDGFHEYQEGEKVYLRYYNDTVPDDVMLYAMVFAGSGDSDSIYNCGSAMGTNSLTIAYTVPEDGYNVQILLVMLSKEYIDADYNVGMSANLYELDVEDLTYTAAAKKGDTLTSDLGDAKAEYFLNPITGYMTYGYGYKLSLNPGDKGTLTFEIDATKEKGMMSMIYDEQFNVVYWAGINPSETEYINELAAHYISAKGGTYYIVISGYFFGDDAKVTTYIDDYAGEYYAEKTINLADLGTEAVGYDPASGTVDPDYGYAYYYENNYGWIELCFPGIYTITGENESIDINVCPKNMTHVVLKDASFQAIILFNETVVSEVVAEGENTMLADRWGSAIYAYFDQEEDVYNQGGVSFGGSGSIEAEGKYGAYLVSAPVHFGCASTHLVGNSTGDTFACLVQDANITLGKDAKISDNQVVGTLWATENKYEVAGHCISENEDVIWTEGFQANLSKDATITCSATAGGLRGDANGDGKVNTGDAAIILKYAAAGNTGIEGQNLANADYNADGKVNTGDAAAILKAAAAGNL